MHVHPQGGEQFFSGPNLQGKVVSAPQAECTPETDQESNFLRKLGDMDVGARGYLGSFIACVLKATTKKGRQLFEGRKVHPRQNPGYVYE